jgi:hypothetical protein
VDVQFERSVPKFLQPYAHLLDRGKKRPRPQIDDAADAEDDDVGDAVRNMLAVGSADAFLYTRHS